MAVQVQENLQSVLDTILGSFLDLVRCDAGSVYTVRQESSGEKVLKFEAMITRSLGIQGVPADLRTVRLKIDETTIAGKTAARREAIVVNPDSKSGHSPSSRVLNYHTKNIFSGPLITPRGDLVGVVQLLNKLPTEGAAFDSSDDATPPPFDDRDRQLFSMIVGQSALAVENSLLLEEQERLIEGFVDACVTAIEARDPVTSGHSVRVANLTLGLADAVNRTTSGPLSKVHFSPMQLRELRFAAMLHDIGKIGVKEAVLQKEKRLFPYELEVIDMRLRLMRAEMSLRQHRDGVDYKQAINQLNKAWFQILQANEPMIECGATAEVIEALQSLSIVVGPNQALAALTASEARKLSVRHGTLTEEERIEIESHAAKTFEILKLIPWGRGLEHVPDIAHKHHERLDGTGYPLAIGPDSIPPQTRMMSICDIYDALRAKDRPYKAALPVEGALDIIASEVKEGKLDKAYFDLFIEARIYEATRTPSAKSGGAAA
jgi:HD-GYP domain-containing protein (c-di-GMP phosphodiesterase class II)